MIKEPLASEILEKLVRLEPTDFVKLLVEHLELRLDFREVHPGPPAGRDKKIDITALMVSETNETKRVAFQCKRYGATPLNTEAAFETFVAEVNSPADIGILVSTREPTPDAKDFIAKLREQKKGLIWYEDWCGTSLVKTLGDRTPSVLIRWFPELRGKLTVAHELEPLCPSFEIVPVSALTNNSAEQFYNGFPPTWEDLEASRDIPRNIYEGPTGIRAVVSKCLQSDGVGPKVIALLGVAGAGKTTLLLRAGFDAARLGVMVVRLRSDWMLRPVSLAHQIRELARAVAGPILVLVDDAADLVFDMNIFEGTLHDLRDTNRPIVFLISEHPDRWNLARKKIHHLTQGSTYLYFGIHHLFQNECETLVDRVLSYESKGVVSTYCALDRNERLKLCLVSAERQMLVALLQLRHGLQFKQIIISEYESVPTNQAKLGYATVCYLQSLGLKAPLSVLLSSVGAHDALSIEEFVSATEGLLLEDDIGMAARHSVIGRAVARHALKTPQGRARVLIGVASALKAGDITHERVFSKLIAAPDIHRRIVTGLERKAEIVRSVYEAILLTPICQIHDFRKQALATYGLVERMLRNFDNARSRFKSAIALDSQYAFALRQWAWLEHYLGNWKEAADLAIRTASLAPQEFAVQYQCGRILMFNTVENFRKAKLPLERATELEPANKGAQKSLERYRDAVRILGYLGQLQADGLIPEPAAAKLRPGLAFLRAMHGPNSRQTRERLTSELRTMEENASVEEPDILDAASGINFERNPIIAALVACNLARARYWQWYHRDEAHDMEQVEELFKKSLELNAADPFTHCWYGTFLKEVRNDYSGARREYGETFKVAANIPNPRLQRHPLFLNNMALLLMDEFELGFAGIDSLFEAQKLLREAVEKSNSDFYWPVDTLSRCIQLIDAAGGASAA